MWGAGQVGTVGDQEMVISSPHPVPQPSVAAKHGVGRRPGRGDVKNGSVVGNLDTLELHGL